MDNMGRGYCYIKCSYYVLINCIRHCVRGEFIQNYFNILSFLLIWDKNLGSHTGWPVAKTLWIRPWLYKDGCASCKLGSARMLLGVKTAPKIKLRYLSQVQNKATKMEVTWFSDLVGRLLTVNKFKIDCAL